MGVGLVMGVLYACLLCASTKNVVFSNAGVNVISPRSCYRNSKQHASTMDDKMLSYRRETALQGALYFSPKVEEWNSDTIHVFYRHDRSIFNHCDIIGLKICRIP